MKTQISSFKELYIPKPCHQNWDEMTITEQGKFCASCRKVVYDFSDKTEEDFNFLYKSNNGNICGRFREDQLNQDLKYLAAFKRNSLVVSFRRAASFLITFITLKIASVREGFAQSELSNRIEMVLVNSEYRKTREESVDIKGQVRKGDTQEGMDYAFVKLYDARGNMVASTLTDVNGFFLLTLPASVKPDQTFSIVANKEKEKRGTYSIKYTRDKKKIFQKDFGLVILSVDYKSNGRRNILGRRYPRLMGCPTFR